MACVRGQFFHISEFATRCTSCSRWFSFKCQFLKSQNFKLRPKMKYWIWATFRYRNLCWPVRSLNLSFIDTGKVKAEELNSSCLHNKKKSRSRSQLFHLIGDDFWKWCGGGSNDFNEKRDLFEWTSWFWSCARLNAARSAVHNRTACGVIYALQDHHVVCSCYSRPIT